MRQDISTKKRKELSTKMAKVFSENVKMLSKEMREVLIDDLVTAYLSRLAVLARVENSRAKPDIQIRCSNETVEFTDAHAVQDR